MPLRGGGPRCTSLPTSREQHCLGMGLRTELCLLLAERKVRLLKLRPGFPPPPPPNRRKQELQTPTPSFLRASTRKQPCFGQMDWNILLKLLCSTNIHMASAIYWALQTLAPNPISKLWEGMCVHPVPSLEDRRLKKITQEEECRWWGQEWV